MKKLNEEQLTQIMKQRAAHMHKRYTIDLKLAEDTVLKDFIVEPEVLRPELVTSIHFARWLYSTYAQGYCQLGHIFDMGSGTGIQGITLLAADAVRSVTFFDNDYRARRNTAENIERFAPFSKTEIIPGDLFGYCNRSFNFGVFNHPFFAADGIVERPEGALGCMLSSPNTIHRFFEQARKRLVPGGRIAMPFFHKAPEWNDPGIVGPEHGYRVVMHDKIKVSEGLQQGGVSFYLLVRSRLSDKKLFNTPYLSFRS